MKTIIRRYPFVSKRLIIAGFFVFLVFSCSKNNDTPAKAAAKFCSTINWNNTIKLSGYFKGELINGNYGLTSASISDNAVSKIITFSRDGSGHLINGSGFTYTYNQDKLVKIVESDGTGSGSGTFTFDTNGHLTNSDIESTDAGETLSLKYTYTYDSNDDPVKIIGHGISTGSSGTSTADYDITADYLTDKQSYLPLFPEITPFTIDFAYGFYLSKHLINKWVIKISGTTEQGAAIPTVNFTQQYTYTYDASGNVATMVHTGNSNNIYTFTYSGCN